MRIPQKKFQGLNPEFTMTVRRFGQTIGLMFYIINGKYYINISKPEGLEAYEIDKSQYGFYLKDYHKSFADHQEAGDNFAKIALSYQRKGQTDLATFYWNASIVEHNRAFEAKR